MVREHRGSCCGSKGVDGMLRQLDALTELQRLFGRDYEAVLRMLQEARTEIRNSQEQLRPNQRSNQNSRGSRQKVWSRC